MYNIVAVAPTILLYTLLRNFRFATINNPIGYTTVPSSDAILNSDQILLPNEVLSTVGSSSER
jgi:hypothetical protein